MIRKLALGAVAGLLLAGAASAQSYGYGGYDRYGYGDRGYDRYGYRDDGARGAIGFMVRAGQSDRFEIESSRLALSYSRDWRVRQFADTMIRDHSYTSDQLMRAARYQRFAPPPSPPPLRPDQQDMLERLRSARGYDFDRSYIDEQVQAHRQALELMQGYAQNGDNPEFRRIAATAVPIIRHHLEMAERMSDRRGY